MDNRKRQLAGIVGKENVSDDPGILDLYARDNSFSLPMKPWFVAKPSSADEIQDLVTWANETATPLIPVSSGPPHFHGDTVPTAPGAVIVEFSRMCGILRIDRRNRMTWIEPGVTYSQLQPELAKEGLRLTTPLMPRPNKSVIASLLERQPTLIPRYHYSFPEPLRNCGVVWGSGAATFTGEAGDAALSLEAQWKEGIRHTDLKGPKQVDYVRLLTGAQGSMGIVTWASARCELIPAIRKLFFVPAHKPELLIDFMYRLLRVRLGDEVVLLNSAQLACMLGSNAEQVAVLNKSLPSWVLIVGIGGRALFPEKRVDQQQKDLADLAQTYGVALVTGISGATTTEVYDTLLSPSREPYWKLNYKGACEQIFFLTTLDKCPECVDIVCKTASARSYPLSDIGIYIQPQHQGVAHHCEFSLPYNPEDPKEVANIKDLYLKASEALICRGAYFSRPYGMWADMVYSRDAQSTSALRKVKRIFDPNDIMNPGKLCF